MDLTFTQLKRSVEELKSSIQPPNKFHLDIPQTTEVLRCCKELKLAQSQAKQRLIAKGVSDAELKECERRGFGFDPLVVKACHNRLRALWNAKDPNHNPTKINFLFDEELQLCP
jgi:hypothetical protein